MDKKVLAKRLLWGKNPRHTLLRTLVLGMVVGLTVRFAFRPSMLDGSSMEPTYEDRSLNVNHKAGGVDRKQIVGRIVFTKEK